MRATLTQLIERRAVTPCALALMQQPAIEAMALMRCGNVVGSITPDSFVIDCETRTVEVVPIGTTPQESTVAADLAAYGSVLLLAIEANGAHLRRLERFARRCCDGEFAHWEDARLTLERLESSTIYWVLVALILLLLLLLKVES